MGRKAPLPRRLRGRIWWARYYHNGKLVQESTKTTDRAEAERVLRKKMKPANTTLFVAPTAARLTFEDLIDLARTDALEDENRRAYRLGTADHPRGPVRHLTAWFEGRAALSSTDKEVLQYRTVRLAEGAKLATVQRELAVLRRGFKLALKKHQLPTMPDIPFRQEKNARKGFVEPAEFEALLGELRCRSPIAADFVECCYLTLLRRGNVRTLTWTHFRIDVDHGQVVGGELRLDGDETKNEDPLLVPLTGRLLALIDRRWQAHGDTLGIVFPHSVRKFRRAWAEATAAIDRPGLLVHDLRRSAARTLVRAGVPETIVMRKGGWRSRTMPSRWPAASARRAAASASSCSSSPRGRRPLPPTPRGRYPDSETGIGPRPSGKCRFI